MPIILNDLNHLIIWNFLFCTVLSLGSSKVDLTHKFDDFLIMIQLFSMTPYTVLVGIKVIRNYVINRFKLHQLSRIHSFHPKESLKLAKFSDFAEKISNFAEKIVFWSTLQAPSKKTVHLQELVMVFKVAVNNIVDIIHFDKNTIRCHWK